MTAMIGWHQAPQRGAFFAAKSLLNWALVKHGGARKSAV
ncbi:hypothetical protein ACZ87_00765 [Candidatus Erwinia dacicola]|uniref:Uncharacterized protein n=1 Tax=Candidatus Erwinia dacicola TaxID=252393 RepID=A0A328TTJ6_9GAMM|nr:hypothetical protein ACZ87_00765 [Candidatus Erwinia dacicola]